MNCPGCGHAMAAERYETHSGASMEIDACHSCNSLWFDGKESLMLSPRSVLSMFRVMHEREVEAAGQRLTPDQMQCPRCQGGLVHTHDQVKATCFEYRRCGEGCGRFISFVQWMREKGFARDLDKEQIKELQKHLKVVRCSNCGAPVDLQRRAVCEYCKAAVCMLDPQAIQKTLEDLRAVDGRTTAHTGQMAAIRRELASVPVGPLENPDAGLGASGALGLVGAGLGLLFSLLDS